MITSVDPYAQSERDFHALPRLADFECRHGRIPGDSTPECGCFEPAVEDSNRREADVAAEECRTEGCTEPKRGGRGRTAPYCEQHGREQMEQLWAARKSQAETIERSWLDDYLARHSGDGGGDDLVVDLAREAQERGREARPTPA